MACPRPSSAIWPAGGVGSWPVGQCRDFLFRGPASSVGPRANDTMAGAANNWAAGVRAEPGCGTFQSDKESQGVMSSVTVAASLAGCQAAPPSRAGRVVGVFVRAGHDALVSRGWAEPGCSGSAGLMYTDPGRGLGPVGGAPHRFDAGGRDTLGRDEESADDPRQSRLVRKVVLAS